MDDVIVNFEEKGDGAFLLKNGEEQLGKMVVRIAGKSLTVYHTEVVPEAEGRGLAKKLLLAMVQYARSNNLKVIPLCPYVHAQFKRNPAEYADIWKRDGEKEEQII